MSDSSRGSGGPEPNASPLNASPPNGSEPADAGEYAATAGADPGTWLHDLVATLLPPMRSITGDGVRTTLATVARALGPEPALTVHEVPSGTPVLDWTVPREWNVASARLTGPDGKTVVDAADNPLHLLGYSTPVRARLSLDELRPHLFSMPDRPDWVPYRTSYYTENWGFCLTDRQLAALPDGEYDVEIDTTLTAGSLTYGEIVLPGTTDDEFLITTHTCHPAMANDNCSGIATATLLARTLAGLPRRHTFRLLFIPGTIGSITWLARNRDTVGRIRHGLVLTGLGDRSDPTYKRSRRRSPRPGGRTGSSTSPPTATTNGSSAPLASTCPSAGSGAASTATIRSTTRPRTTSTS